MTDPRETSAEQLARRSVPYPWLAAATIVALVVLGGLVWQWRRLAKRAQADAPAAIAAVAKIAPEIRTVVVLPFASDNARDAKLADQMRDDLARALGQVADLRITGRTSSYAFRGKQTPVSEVGRTLHVAGVVEGSVRHVRDSLHVTAQLTSVLDGRVTSSHTYDARIADTVAVRDSLTRAIVSALKIAEGARTTDSTSAEARLARATTLLGLGKIDSAVAEARNALALDPLSSQVHVALAAALTSARRFQDAIVAAREAVALDSSSASAAVMLAYAYAFAGHADSARVALSRAHPGRDVPGLRGVALFVATANHDQPTVDRLRKEIARRRGASDYDDLVVAALDSDRTKAIDILHRTDRRPGDLARMTWSLGCDPVFDPLKADARFAAILTQRGLTVCPAMTR